MKNKGNIFNLTAQYLESPVVQYNSWLTGAGIQWTDRKCYWPEGRGSGRQYRWRTVRNRRWRASHSFTHAWRWWNAHLHLWKLTTWRFVCRRLNCTAVTLCQPPLSLWPLFPPLPQVPAAASVSSCVLSSHLRLNTWKTCSFEEWWPLSTS